MALASLPTTALASFAGCARRVEVLGTSTAIILDDGRRHIVAVRPDPAGAMRMRRAVNHLASVRIEGTLEHATARVRAIGNRLPVDLAVPVAVALALVDAGVPALVHLQPESGAI